jgi:choline monooxygenase
MNTKPLQLDVNEQIECAHTLASRFYTDPAILDIEKTRIFLRTWQLVGTLNHACGEVDGVKRTIADPESFFTADVAGEPIIVVRDKQGVLRAFSNVCRHRAGPIALGSGCKNVLRCQYHGWTYTLDGRLIGTPDVEGVEFFDRSTMGMVPLRVEVWEQFIFVNFDLQAEPLASYFGKIPAQVHGFQFEGLQFAERRDYVINCNWKVYVDNYLEGYHIPVVHPSLHQEIDYGEYRVEPHRYWSLQHAPLRPVPANAADGSRKYVPVEDGEQAQYYWLFPNVMLNVYQGQMQTNVVLPRGHARCEVVFEWYSAAPPADPAADPHWTKLVAFSDEIQDEDIEICVQVQKNLRSRAYDRGRYSAAREVGVHHFHSLLHEFL